MRKKIILLNCLFLISSLSSATSIIHGSSLNIEAGRGEHIINDGTITYNGDNGMAAKDGGSIENQGNIENTGAGGMYVSGVHSSGVNKGTISNTGKQGMQSVDGGTVINEGTIANLGTVGMYAHDPNSVAINRGIILTKTNPSETNPRLQKFGGMFGMVALQGGTVINEGTVKNSGDYGIQSVGSGSNAQNAKAGTIANGGERGIYVRGGGSSTNKGIVSNTGNKGAEIDGIGSSFVNEGTVSNKGNVGIIAKNGARVINDSTGTIKNLGNSGMVADGSNSESENKNIIENGGMVGMSSVNGGTSTNHQTGTIQNKGSYGMSADGSGSSIINEGIIFNKANYGMSATNGANAINKGSGIIKNTEDYGMSAVGTGSSILNQGTVSNTGDKKMHGKNGASIVNEGTIENITNGQVGMFLENPEVAKNTGTINVTDGIGVKANHSNFFNSGTINADGQKAIEMDDTDSILELASGSTLKGNTNGMAGEDTLVLSGNGNVDVGNHSIHNFEKLVVTGDITAKGTYNIGVSDNSGYKTSAFGTSATYDVNDVTGATGNLTLDGTINLAVDYDGIGASGTDKTGRVIAQTITKTNNGHIRLVNGGSTTSGIIEEYLKSNHGSNFRVKGLATVSGAQVVDPDLIETPNLMDTKPGWRSVTIADRTGQNGSLLIDQNYIYSGIPMIALTPAKQVIPMSTLTPAKQVIPMSTLTPAKQVIPMSTSTSTKQVTKNNKSKLLIPRNKVDYDSINRLTNITSNFTKVNELKKGDGKLIADYLGTKGASYFRGTKSYNYDYETSSDGMVIGYMEKVSDNLTIGSAFSYEDADVDYKGVKIHNTYVSAPGNHHSEKIKTYNTELFGKYEVTKSLDLNFGIAYGLSHHKLNTNFVSGMKESDYDSKILKTGIGASYKYPITETLKIVPSVGVDYFKIIEDDYSYKNSSVKLEDTTSDNFMGTIALDLIKDIGQIHWSIGGGYHRTSKENLKDKRNVSGYPLEVEEINIDRNSVFLEGDAEYNVTEDFSIRIGYEYETSNNYSNHNIHTGFAYRFDSINSLFSHKNS